jgi:hypothetical protein
MPRSLLASKGPTCHCKLVVRRHVEAEGECCEEKHERRKEADWASSFHLRLPCKDRDEVSR